MMGAPRQSVWSLDGKDGNWNYDSLAELVRDNYGHDSDGDGHPASYRAGLYEGDTVFKGRKHFDDPAGFVVDVDDVLDAMGDNACSSDAGEYADHYPEVDDVARAALAVALEPLQAWARQYCQPTFFTVQNVTPHVLLVEEVMAARAQPVPQLEGDGE